MAATISLEELIGYLATFQKKTTAQCVDMMRNETPKGRTGALKASIGILSSTPGHVTIGTNMAYAEAVVKGRKAVYPKPGRSAFNPKHAHSLYWVDYDGDEKSVHHGVNARKALLYSRVHDDGARVYRMSAGPSRPNDFVSRTVKDIQDSDLSIEKGFLSRWGRK